MFDPFAGILASNATGVTSTTRPFTDIALNASGSPTGPIVAQGAGSQAGVSSLTGFSAVFRGNFVVSVAGNYTFNVGSADGFIFGAGNGATRVSGLNANPPASGMTVFALYPVMGANNAPSTNATVPIVVNFPAAGSYPYEFDYKSGTGGPLSLAVTVTRGSATVGLRSLTSLVLTSSGSNTQLVGQQDSFTVQANDETGAPAANVPINVNVSGANPQILATTTGSNGQATVHYSGTTGTDLVQATATIAGLAAYSNQASVNWVTGVTPTISVSGTQLLNLAKYRHLHRHGHRSRGSGRRSNYCGLVAAQRAERCPGILRPCHEPDHRCCLHSARYVCSSIGSHGRLRNFHGSSDRNCDRAGDHRPRLDRQSN
jgi:hypothetical protein